MTFPLSSLSPQLMAKSDKSPQSQLALLGMILRVIINSFDILLLLTRKKKHILLYRQKEGFLCFLI